jgi:hypothetical protein
MLRLLAACLLTAMSHPAFACDEARAFGFQFGRPVPAKAGDVKEFWFQGGTAAGNVIRSFTADVPSPLPGFDNYAYWSNRDRQVVHAVTAFRQLITESKLLHDDAYRRSVLEKTKPEIERLKKSWGEKYGFVYVATTKSELTWEAKTPTVSSTIGILGGEYLYVECVNNALQAKALSIALGRTK